MDLVEEVFDRIEQVSLPDGWEGKVRSDCLSRMEGPAGPSLQLNRMEDHAHIVVTPDVSGVYRMVCGLNDESIRAAEILNVLIDKQNALPFTEVLNATDACVLFAGMSEGESIWDASVASVLVAHHENLIAEFRIVVTASRDEGSMQGAKTWLDDNAVSRYFRDVMRCLSEV